MGLPKTGLEKRMREYACEHTRAYQKQENQTRLCTAIYGRLEGRVGERHCRSPRPALLGQCESVLNEQGKPGEPKKDDTPPLPL